VSSFGDSVISDTEFFLNVEKIVTAMLLCINLNIALSIAIHFLGVLERV